MWWCTMVSFDLFWEKSVTFSKSGKLQFLLFCHRWYLYFLELDPFGIIWQNYKNKVLAHTCVLILYFIHGVEISSRFQVISDFGGFFLSFSFFSIFISSFILTILKRLNLFSKKSLIVRYFEYNKKDNSNLKLLIIFTIFFVIWSLVFLLQ